MAAAKRGRPGPGAGQTRWARLTQKVQTLRRHDEVPWQATEVPGEAVQDGPCPLPGRRLILIRQRVQERPQAGGKTLLEVPGYRFQALVTNLPPSVDALTVWRRYHERADLENPIKELGDAFGIKLTALPNCHAVESLQA